MMVKCFGQRQIQAKSLADVAFAYNANAGEREMYHDAYGLHTLKKLARGPISFCGGKCWWWTARGESAPIPKITRYYVCYE
jgi:hypothetical protein